MQKYDVVLLTEDRYVNPSEVNPYIENVLLEDKLVQNALENNGLKCTRKSWSDPNFDWSSTKIALFRTTWDYFERFNEFSVWLDKVSKQTTLLNSIDQILWNIDKHYLLDLKESGIRIPETIFIEKGENITLEELYQKTGWNKTVLKPAISGAARHTYKLTKENLSDHENIFQELIASEAMLLQVFQENVVTKGEVSIMMMGGKYTHAIIKKAKKGDFRVQDDFGGSVTKYSPSDAEIAFAEKAFAACNPVPTYGRADIIWDNNNELVISELELIEPELWFRFNESAAEHLANAIQSKLLEHSV